MTEFDRLKSKDINELAKWLASFDTADNAPWTRWWNKKYCNNCEIKTVHILERPCRSVDYYWCEVNNKCKFFKELDTVPDDVTIIKMWLESES